MTLSKYSIIFHFLYVGIEEENNNKSLWISINRVGFCVCVCGEDGIELDLFVRKLYSTLEV